MKTRIHTASSQKGFSLLTGFILVIIMFGSLAFFLAGQGINAGFGSGYSNTAKVSSILASAGYISTGFDAVTLDGTAPASVTFDSAATTGIFNPTSGGASPQPLDASLFQLRGVGSTMGALDGYWIYRGNDIAMKGVGDPTAVTPGDYTVMISGLKLSVCLQINNTLHGTPLTGVGSAPISLGALDGAIVGAPSLATPSVASVTSNAVAFNLAGVVALTASYNGWMSGCYATTSTTGVAPAPIVPNYVYIHTLLAI